MEPQVIGPDGRPAVFRGSAWVSSDGQHFWNGAEWQPMARAVTVPRGLIVGLGAAILGIAILFLYPYLGLHTSGNTAFEAGYYIGVLAFFAIVIAVFRFAGRWGTIGILIRMFCGLLALLKILTLIAHPFPG